MSPPLYHYWGSSTDQGVSTRDGFPIRTMLETREIVRGDPETAPAIARPFTVRSGRDSARASTRAPPPHSFSGLVPDGGPGGGGGLP